MMRIVVMRLQRVMFLGIAASLALWYMSFIGCHEPVGGHKWVVTTITGTVRDSATRAPIDSARIFMGDSMIVAAYSDSNGHYRATGAGIGEDSEFEWVVKCEKADYEPKTAIVISSPDRRTIDSVDMSLAPK